MQQNVVKKSDLRCFTRMQNIIDGGHSGLYEAISS